MKSILLIILFVWIGAGAGRILLNHLSVFASKSLERAVYGAALGLLISAYGVFFIGMLGQLSFWPLTLWWIVLAAAGLKGQWLLIQDLRHAAPIADFKACSKYCQIVIGICLLILLFNAFVAIVACFRPPGGHEWDAIAYHLADIKIFLADHKITSLPTEHHSNFPFTMEMLYACGLLYDSYVLANLFHFAMAALTALAMISTGTRLLNKTSGWIGAALFATAPMVLWEASTAYIDLGFGLFSLLSALAVVSAVLINSDKENLKSQLEWIALAGLTMGGALAMKYLALVPLMLFGGLLLFRRVTMKSVLIYFGAAIVIGAPWYIKNMVWTHNPVYPFLFKVFPDSRYWSADRAVPYQAEQDSFGYAHSLHAPAESVRDLIQTPWRLLANADKFANHGDYTYSVLIGGLFTALCFSLLFIKKADRAAVYILCLGVLQLISWFFLAQIGRYLVSMIPMFGLVAGYAASRWLDYGSSGKKSMPWQNRLLQITTAFLLFGQAFLSIWAVIALPTSARASMEKGVMPTVVSLPEDLAVLLDSDKRTEQLRRTLDIYAADEWINANTDITSGVIIYDDARGYYLDRPYLWGNGEHSAYIPYKSMKSGSDLTKWLTDHGIRTVMINLKFSPNNVPSEELPNGPSHSEALALQRWYVDAKFPAGSWRTILADALQSPLWKVQFEGNGVVVISISSGSQ